MDRFRALFGGTGLLGLLFLLTSHSQAQVVSAQPVSRAQTAAAEAPAAPDLFGTVALRITAERFWDDWERARRDASTSPRMRALIRPARHLSPGRQLAYVQTVVTRHIGWRSDATQWGRHDYWASADETLARGAGDIEDRAIVKMQALRALGFPTRDLFLTLGRDTVAGPQALLIVRRENQYFVLDDTGAAPFSPDSRPEFSPALTFAFGAIWAHAHHVANANERTSTTFGSFPSAHGQAGQ